MKGFKIVGIGRVGVEQKKSSHEAEGKKPKGLLCCLITSVPNGFPEKSHGDPEAKHPLYTSAVL